MKVNSPFVGKPSSKTTFVRNPIMIVGDRLLRVLKITKKPLTAYPFWVYLFWSLVFNLVTVVCVFKSEVISFSSDPASMAIMGNQFLLFALYILAVFTLFDWVFFFSSRE